MSLTKSVFLPVPEGSMWRSIIIFEQLFHDKKSFQRNSARRMEIQSFLVLLGWLLAVLLESLRKVLGALEFGVPAILGSSACARGRFRVLEVFDGCLECKAIWVSTSDVSVR